MSEGDYQPSFYNVESDPILNPNYVGSLYVKKASGAPDAEILPAAPSGKLWVLINANVIVEGAGTPSWSFREVVPGEVVRPVDVRSGTTPGSYQQVGALATKGPLRFQNTGATSVTYLATVLALPSSIVQRFWVSLTNAFQTIEVVTRPNAVLRVPFGGFQQGTNSLLWVNNTEAATARTLEFQFTRDGVATATANTASTPANTRATLSALGATGWPPLLPGDVLQARLTTAPVLPVYFGGLLQTVPQLSLS